jgi:cytochrome c oxidase subunit 2
MGYRLRGVASAMVAAAGMAAATGAALAAGMGKPEYWQVGMQEPVTEVARQMHSFHTELMWIITAITLFVLALLVVVIVKFNENANPTPSKTSHNTAIEIAWTVVPVLILLLIAIPSFRLLRNQLVIPKADLTLKVTGHSWYWSYQYPEDQGGGFQFDANIVENADLKPGQPRLLATDNDVVVPVNKVVRVQVTSADVMHSWGVPSLGFTMDAIPGRLNEIWFKADREGTIYGQCRELCGQRHAYMPITIRIVNEAEYATWLTQAKQKFASTSTDRAKFADATR